MQNKLLTKYQEHLFTPTENLPALTDQEIEILKRYKMGFSFWLDKPTLSDKALVKLLQEQFGISRSQAYNDIFAIKVLLGNVRNAEKEWQRFKVISMLDKAYEMAEKQKKPKEMIMAADKLGKYTQLDKEEAQKLPWEKIIPQTFEPTGDIKVLGIEPVPYLSDKQKALRKKYNAPITEDVDHEEVKKDE